MNGSGFVSIQYRCVFDIFILCNANVSQANTTIPYIVPEWKVDMKLSMKQSIFMKDANRFYGNM